MKKRAAFAAMSPRITKGLRRAQREAISFAVNHLNHHESPCLIRMPTGTGKTGVIACLTRLSNPGSSLVLTPWSNLREQMIADLNGGGAFWKRIGTPPASPKVVKLLPGNAITLLKTDEQRVFVSTFAALNQLRNQQPAAYEKLRKALDLVVVDEGHYEPAVEWGQSVKLLEARTVLLTATPYRNDLKLFRITDPSTSTHHYTHRDAVADKVIRSVRFEAITPSRTIGDLTADFVSQWTKAKSSKTLPSASGRAIICCSSAQDIEAVVEHLTQAGLESIGVHEQFKASTNPRLVQYVPNTRTSATEIWVHQHKLTEGLDDHQFCCVAFFSPIRNDRKLIQQIGRVLRRDDSDRESPALILAPAAFGLSERWTAYLEFETHLELLDPRHFRTVVDKLLQSQPSVEYFEGRFRQRFRPEDLASTPRVIVPPSVLVHGVAKDFELDQYVENCTDTLNTEDAVILGTDLNSPCQRSATFALWVYASVKNSRLLTGTSLYEVKLETHCVVVADGLVFVADSAGNYPVDYLDRHTKSLAPDQLARFLDGSFRPTHVSLDSSIPYDTVLRGADLRGHDLLSVAESLTDRVQICRSAKGSSLNNGRRYVGMTNGRIRKEVTEQERRGFELDRFVSWAKQVAAILNSSVDASPIFQRFMPTCSPPPDPTPKNICIDLLRLDLRLTLAGQGECQLRSSAAAIEAVPRNNIVNYLFALDIEAKSGAAEKIYLRVEYQPNKKRFWFKKERGPAVQVQIDGASNSSTKGLAEFLNQEPDAVLIGLEGGEIVYQGRNFYKIDYSHAEKALVDLIYRPSTSLRFGTEKGTPDEIREAKRTKAKRFPPASVFRAIAEEHLAIPFDDPVLICADLGTECADFIAADFTSRKMALIHAKASHGHVISASAFHEVVAQAMKNLVHLTRSRDVPEGVSSWRRDSAWNKTRIPRLYRAPSGTPTGKKLWNRLKDDIIHSPNPELYVVLATTGCCDRQVLQMAVSDPQKRTPETAQLLHLLDGLNGYARQLGVRLMVYDLPYEALPRTTAKKSRRRTRSRRIST